MGIFTSGERRAIYVLIGIIVIGAGVYLYKVKNPFFAPELDRSVLEMKYEEKGIDSLIKLSATIPKKTVATKKKTFTGKMNINTASKDRLTLLPGIGPAYAERIITYRKEKGGFKTIEEIKKVKGIGEKRFLDLKDKITVE